MPETITQTLQLGHGRCEIRTLRLIPDENQRDLKEIPDNIKDDLEIIPVKWIDQVLEVALQRMPEPLPETQVDRSAC